MTLHVTRLAPSPTGSLHLGNARTFLVNWAMARQSGWKIAMRIEDIDSPRIKRETVAETLETLKWLGIDWDGEPLTQSSDLEPYRAAVEKLAADQRVFSCPLTRKEIERSASAPQENASQPSYPRSLRPLRSDMDRWAFAGPDVNYRFVVPDGKTEFDDGLCGCVKVDPAAVSGDFVIWTKRGSPAYQLAVVVDDIRQGVTDVVRGDDLLVSAALQTLIYNALDTPPPKWWHLPLVIGEDGHRLAKRHGDTRIRAYRDEGVSPERVVGLVAFWTGITETPEPMSAADFRLSFDLRQLPRLPLIPRDPVTFTKDDHTWLLSDT